MDRQTTDVLIIGAGIIGVSLALELRQRGASVRVLERGEPGREASYASAGMLAAKDPETPDILRELLLAGAKMYPGWTATLEKESGVKVDFRNEGTLYLSNVPLVGLDSISKEDLTEREPAVTSTGFAYFSDEGSVDPRSLMKAALAAAQNLGVSVLHEHPVSSIQVEDGAITGVRIGDKVISAGIVVNCAGAWGQKIAGANTPSHPVKGQMLSVVSPHDRPPLLKHVVRGELVYLVPRTDGRVLIGATVEKVGFDKRVVPDAILNMQHEAARLVPLIGEMRIHESWAGLRPCSPDKLPLVGETAVRGYFAATGHYRNGILLAPITAKILASLISGEKPPVDVSRFDPKRFA